MTIEEILSLDDDNKIVFYLKQRKTKAPNKQQLWNEWNTEGHEINDPALHKDRQVLDVPEYIDENGVLHKAVYKTEPVNRISIPMEQDIINIHTAFTVGTEPELICETTDTKETNVLEVLKAVFRQNKITYLNKKVVRSWFAEQEVAEYWYTVKDSGFWQKLLSKFKNFIPGNVTPTDKLRCVVWSPFRGDNLYPFFDDTNDYKALSREYKIKSLNGTESTFFQTVTDTDVIVWKMDDGKWKRIPEKSFKHGFKKNPTIYTYRAKSLCANIKSIRTRIEKLLSNYADCIDYHFFPYLILEGEVERMSGLNGGSSKGRQIKLEHNAKAYYLTWDQTPTSVQAELDNLTDRAYDMTSTPRITFKNLHGVGNAVSGVAFKYVFMGAHMAVENHAEEIGEYLQRRVNFLISAVGEICPRLKDATQTIDVEAKIVPYMIDDDAEKL